MYKIEFGKIGNDVIGRIVWTGDVPPPQWHPKKGKLRQRSAPLADDYVSANFDWWNNRGRKFEYWVARNRYTRRVLKVLKANGMR